MMGVLAVLSLSRGLLLRQGRGSFIEKAAFHTAVEVRGLRTMKSPRLCSGRDQITCFYA